MEYVISNFWGIFGALLSFISIYYTLSFQILGSSKDRVKIAHWLRHPVIWFGYRAVLKRGLALLRWIFSQECTSKAFGLCLYLAFFYPIVFFIVAWAFGGPTVINKDIDSPEGFPFHKRAALAAFFLLIFSMLRWGYWTFRALKNTPAEIKKWSIKIENFWNSFRTPTSLVCWGALTCALFYISTFSGGAIGVIFAVAAVSIGGSLWMVLFLTYKPSPATRISTTITPGPFLTIFLLALQVVAFLILSNYLGTTATLLGILIGALAVLGKGNIALTIAGILVMEGFITGALSMLGGININIVIPILIYLGLLGSALLWLFGMRLHGGMVFTAFLIILGGHLGIFFTETIISWVLVFFLILPFINGVMDFISWAISRKLIRHMLINPSRWTIFGHIGLDAFLAMFFLFVLAFLLSLNINYLNSAFYWVGWPIVNWEPLLQSTKIAPFTQGFMITGMLVTTLFPTFLHLFVGLTLFTLKPMPGREYMANLLEEPKNSWQQLIVPGWCLMAGLVSCIIFYIGCYVVWKIVEFSGSSVGGYLYAITVWIACWVGSIDMS